MSDLASDLAWSHGRLATEVQRRKRAERKYNDLLAGIAKAVVLELRAAKYIEIHEHLPAKTEANA